MTEYIERETLIEAAKHNIPIGRCEADIVDVKRLIEAAPAADVRPERHGEWKKASYDRQVIYCSSCGERSPCDWDWDFCPRCGAKMDGRDGENNEQIH